MSVKLLDYGYKSPFRETIGSVRFLAWPVAVYRITLPYLIHGKDENDLNPLERVILKLLDIISSLEMPQDDSKMSSASVTERKLAYATSLKLDLVRAILLRLHDRGYIDEHDTPTEIKRKQWDAQDEKYRYVPALVFRELACGELLPFIHIITDKTPLRKVEEDEKKRMFHIHGFPTRDQKDSYPAPSAQDVIMIKKAMLKRALAYGDKEAVPSLTQISVVNQPEYYYLNCPIAIQKGDEDFRIADPFEAGFSLVLEKSFASLLSKDQKLKEWFLDWKKNLSQITKAKESDADRFWNGHKCRNLFPNLIANLHPGHDQMYRSIRKIYASIEWALYYYCIKRDFGMAINKLELTQMLVHQEMLKQSAQKIGFIVTKDSQEASSSQDFIFQAVRPGKILDFKNGQAEMPTVLAISLLIGEKHNEDTEIRKLAKSHPDFLWKIMEIKSERDSTLHGNNKRAIEGGELSSDAFMRDVVQTLLPEVQFPENPLTGTTLNRISDTRLDAITSLQAFFDFTNYNKLSENARNCLINAERFVLESDCQADVSLDASVFISNLYSALQATIRPHLQKYTLVNISDDDFYKFARESAIKAGFPDIPEELSRVRPSKIRETMQGNDKSLGACLIAFLILTDEDDLQLLHSRDPSFLEDVSEIITRRGHDNQSFKLAHGDILSWRKKAFHSINTLLEI